MELSMSQIVTIIKENPSKAVVARGRNYNKKLRMHIYGEELDVQAEVVEIKGYERKDQRDLRAKYARSNKDLFERLKRPTDNVFTANGGSVYFNLNDAKTNEAHTALSNLRGGLNVKEWTETYWLAHMLDDPYGLMMLEIMRGDEQRKAYAKGHAFTYPTYVSIQRIYDYHVVGRNLEYVVLNLEKDELKAMGLDVDKKAFRVIDDVSDMIVTLEGENVYINEELTLPNPWGYVQGAPLSGIMDTSVEVGFLSVYDKAIELADEFFLKGTIKIIYEFKHGFPKYWEFADDCNVCLGTRFQGSEPCKSCHGSGKAFMQKVSDVKLLAWPKKDESGMEDINVAPNVAGYVEPSKQYWEIATSDLQLLEDLMNLTIWGTMSRSRAQGLTLTGATQQKTATEVIDEVRPQTVRLAAISSDAERIIRFMIDGIIRVQIQKGYKGVSFNLGRRFVLENPDAIWLRYQTARKEGAAVEVLNDMLLEYYESKYKNDRVRLNVCTKLMAVEPYIHNTVSEVKDWPINGNDKLRKAMFSEWRATVVDGVITALDVQSLVTMLASYVQLIIDANAVLTTVPADTWGVGTLQAYSDMCGNPMLSGPTKELLSVHIYGIKPEVAAVLFANEPKFIVPQPVPALPPAA